MFHMLYFFLNQFLVYGPLIFSGIIIILMILIYLSDFYKKLKIFQKLSFKKLAYFLIVATLIFDVGLVGVQYFVWQANSFSIFFLPPYQPWSYFLSYSFFHFFLADVVSLFLALFFYLIFKAFKKYKTQFISERELDLLFLSSLLIASPKILFFISSLLLLGILSSLFNFIVFKKMSISWPRLIIFTLLLSFLGAGYFLRLIGLGTLFI